MEVTLYCLDCDREISIPEIHRGHRALKKTVEIITVGSTQEEEAEEKVPINLCGAR
jgi:hypothetical protein